MKKYTYGEFTPEHFEKMLMGLKLFNNQQYWECHEALEDVWMEDSQDNARYVVWAIIQVSTGLYHFKNGNEVGASGQVKKALEKIKKVESLNVENQYLEEKLEWSQFKKRVKKADKNGIKIILDLKFPSEEL